MQNKTKFLQTVIESGEIRGSQCMVTPTIVTACIGYIYYRKYCTVGNLVGSLSHQPSWILH